MRIFNRMTMFLAAGAIALTGFTAPARADGNDTAAALAGIAALAIILGNNSHRSSSYSYGSRNDQYYGSRSYNRHDNYDNRSDRFDRGDHRGKSRADLGNSRRDSRANRHDNRSNRFDRGSNRRFMMGNQGRRNTGRSGGRQHRSR